MILVKIQGGLGNQMFQYAFGLAIAKRNKQPLYLDLSWFDDYGTNTKRIYKLNHFKLNANTADQFVINHFKPRNNLFSLYINRLKNRFLPLRFNSYFTESITYDSSFLLNNVNNIYLDGTWMNEKYFNTEASLIKQLFSKKPILNNYHTVIEDFILKTTSVSVHVRRGDYVNNPNTYKFHGLIPLEYYTHLITKLTSQLKNPHFFFFSDDINWVKKNFNALANYTFVSHQSDDTDIEELYLMSLCKHNIIANSTFSWWAGWLNPNIDKCVYVPQKWSSLIPNSESIVPKSWVIVNEINM